jgi:hypothetical protein
MRAKATPNISRVTAAALAAAVSVMASAHAQQLFNWESGVQAWEDTPWDGMATGVGTITSSSQGAQALRLDGVNGFSWGGQRLIEDNPFDPAHHDPVKFQQLLNSTKLEMDVTFYPGTAKYSLMYLALNYGGHFISSGQAPPGPPGTPGYQIGVNPNAITQPVTITYVWDFVASMTAGGQFGSAWADVSNYILIHSSLNSAPPDNGTADQGNATYGFDNMRVLRETTSDPSWNVDANGDWSNGGNWANGVPNGAGSLAILDAAKLTADRTITNNASVSVGSLILDATFNQPVHNYTISGTGTLNFDTAAGDSTLTVIHGTLVNQFNVTNDVPVSHTIAVPVVANKNLNIDVGSSSTLTMSSGISVNSTANLTKSSIGTLIASRVTGNGGLNVDGGLLQITAGATANSATSASTVNSLAVGPTAKLDLTNNKLTVNYGAGPSPAASIEAMLTSGYGSGSWNGSTGITTSSSTTKTGLGWKDDTGAQAVLVKYALYGDGDLSGSVDLTDFTFLAANFNKASGATWLQGDYNYDDQVNLTDFTFLASNFNQSLPSSSLGSAVPEPGIVGAIGIAAGLLVRRRRA